MTEVHEKIRAGTCGRIVNVDGRRDAALFDGARAKVIQRLYFPDSVIIEILDDGATWHRGTVGEVPIRYFIPERYRGMESKRRLRGA